MTSGSDPILLIENYIFSGEALKLHQPINHELFHSSSLLTHQLTGNRLTANQIHEGKQEGTVGPCRLNSYMMMLIVMNDDIIL